MRAARQHAINEASSLHDTRTPLRPEASSPRPGRRSAERASSKTAADAQREAPIAVGSPGRLRRPDGRRHHVQEPGPAHARRGHQAVTHSSVQLEVPAACPPVLAGEPTVPASSSSEQSIATHATQRQTGSLAAPGGHAGTIVIGGQGHAHSRPYDADAARSPVNSPHSRSLGSTGTATAGVGERRCRARPARGGTAARARRRHPMLRGARRDACQHRCIGRVRLVPCWVRRLHNRGLTRPGRPRECPSRWRGERRVAEEFGRRGGP